MTVESAPAAEVPGRRPGRAAVRLAAVGVAALVWGGCILPETLPSFFGGHMKMRVVVSEKLNRASPVAVEVLVVYDKGTFKALEKLTARDWFAQRAQFLKDNEAKKKKKFDHWKWEWVPGQTVPEQVRPYGVGVAGGLIFANYFSPGDHRAGFQPFEPFLLSLGASDFTVEPVR